MIIAAEREWTVWLGVAGQAPNMLTAEDPYIRASGFESAERASLFD